MALHLWSHELYSLEPGIQEGLTIIGGFPVLYLPRSKTMILADLHIGIENVLASHGAYIPVSQNELVLKKLAYLADHVSVNEVVINGDFKDSFAITAKGEMKQIRRILTRMTEIFSKVTVIKGNHDNFLKWAAQGLPVDIEPSYLIRDRQYYFTHGHKHLTIREEEISLLSQIKWIIIGHEHPVIKVRSEVGATATFPAMIKGKIKRPLVFDLESKEEIEKEEEEKEVDELKEMIVQEPRSSRARKKKQGKQMSLPLPSKKLVLVLENKMEEFTAPVNSRILPVKQLPHLLILPAFTELSSGTNMLSVLSPDQLLSPISREYLNVDEAIPYVLEERSGVLSFPSLRQLRTQG